MRALTVSTKELSYQEMFLKWSLNFTRLNWNIFLHCSGLLIIYLVRKTFDRFSIIDMNENIFEKFTLLIWRLIFRKKFFNWF